MKKLSIIVPIYNEEESLRHTISSIIKTMKQVPFSYEIICVDDASFDRSAKILLDLKKSSLVHVISHPINMGYGASLKSGIRASKGDWILITDADGTYPIKQIPRLLSKKKDYNMVVGARTGNKVSIPFLRRPVKFFLNKYSSYLAGRPIPDLNSGLRVFDKDIALKYWNLFPERFSFTSTITMICATKGYSTLFVPINYFKRKGKSSIHPLKDTVRFFGLLSKLSIYFNPLRAFIPMALLVFVFSLLRAIRDFMVSSDQHIGNFAIGLFFLSIQIFFFGLLAEIISKK